MGTVILMPFGTAAVRDAVIPPSVHLGQYAKMVFDATNTVIRLVGTGVPQTVAMNGTSVDFSRVGDERHFLKFAAGTGGNLRRFSARFYTLPEGRIEKIWVEASARTPRGAVTESHKFEIRREFDVPPTIKITDGIVDLTEVRRRVESTRSEGIAFDRGVPTIEIRRAKLSTAFLGEIFSDFDEYGDSDAALIFGLTVFAASQFFHKNVTGERLYVSENTDDLFVANNMQSLLEFLQHPDSANITDLNDLVIGEEFVELLERLAETEPAVLRQGLDAFGIFRGRTEALTLLEAVESVLKEVRVRELRRIVNQSKAGDEVKELFETLSELLEQRSTFAISIQLPKLDDRLVITVNADVVTIEARAGRNSSVIDLKKYHQGFLSPLVDYVLGNQQGPIKLIRTLASPDRVRKVTRPELQLISGGIT